MKQLPILMLSTLLFSVLVLQVTVSAAPTNGLVASYYFDGNANDTSGNGHDGSVSGATLTSDRLGNSNSAYSFDGVDDYIGVGYSDDFQLSSLTISAWVRPSEDLASVSKHTSIVTRGEDASTDQAAFGLSVTHASSSWGNGVSAHYEDNGDTDYFFDTPYYPQAGSWTHLAATRDSSGQLNLYGNGQLLETWDSTPDPTTNCFQDLVIGAYWYNPSSPYLANFFPGSIDDVFLYNRALSASEIGELYGGIGDSTAIPAPGALTLGAFGYGLLTLLRRRKAI